MSSPESPLPVPFEYDHSLTCLIRDQKTALITPAISVDNFRDFGGRIGAKKITPATAFSTVIQAMPYVRHPGVSKLEIKHFVLGPMINETGDVVKPKAQGIIVAEFPKLMERILDAERPIDRLGPGLVAFYTSLHEHLTLNNE